jgi:hypothetical protein
MADELNQDGTPQKMDPTRELYEQLLSKAFQYKLEERDMALDRYRRADEQMDTAESFILMGKNAISFLKQASDSSDAIANMAKEIKSIVYKDAGNDSNVNMNFGDLDKKAIIDAIKEDEINNIPDEDLDDETDN